MLLPYWYALSGDSVKERLSYLQEIASNIDLIIIVIIVFTILIHVGSNLWDSAGHVGTCTALGTIYTSR